MYLKGCGIKTDVVQKMLDESNIGHIQACNAYVD